MSCVTITMHSQSKWCTVTNVLYLALQAVSKRPSFFLWLKWWLNLIWLHCFSLNLKDGVPGAPPTALQKGTSKSELDHLNGLFQLEMGPSGGSGGVWVSQHDTYLICPTNNTHSSLCPPSQLFIFSSCSPDSLGTHKYGFGFVSSGFNICLLKVL